MIQIPGKSAMRSEMTSCEHEWDTWWEARPSRGAREGARQVRTWVRSCPNCHLSEIRPVPPGEVPSDEDRNVVGRLIPPE